MEKNGKYIYCIIGTRQERNFGSIGIGGRGDEVLTISYDDLSMVVSNCPMNKIVVSRQNLLGHEKVVEKVMQEFDSVLPVKFGTIAAGADEIRELLDRRNREFKDALKYLNHKIELGVKGIWKNMEVIFREIAEENEDIRKANEEIQDGEGKKNMQARLEIGKMVEQALLKKKETEAERLADILRRMSSDYKLNKTFSDEMFMNAAFLVDRGREKEFDNIMGDLGEEHKDRIKFMYTGPLPPYNFVNIVIYPEEWEK